jgi:uncharacterized protein (UPF0332 family)
MEELIKMTPNPERAVNILQQVELRLKDANNKNPDEFATLIIEAYYEVIKELLTALLAVDGWKTLSHTALIEYLRKEYSKQFAEHEIQTIDELRKIRNRIAYEGFLVKKDYYDRKSPIALEIISKLKKLVKENAVK